MFRIKQSEPITNKRKIPFMMFTDKNVATTGLSFSGSEIKVVKADNSEANFAGSVTENASGIYIYTFTTTEINTLGFLLLKVSKTGYKNYNAWLQVISKDPYEVVTVDNSGADATTTTFKLTAGINANANDYYKGGVIAFRTGALAPQARKITGYTNSSNLVTVTSPFTAAPSNGDEAIIIGRID